MLKTNISLSKLIILLVVLYLAYWAVLGFVIVPNELVVKKETIKTSNWHKEHDKLKIAIISDVHAGAPFIKENKMKKIVELTNIEKPDIIFLLGDYVSDWVLGSRFVDEKVIAEEFSHLKSRYGLIAVLGNHDWRYNGNKITKAFKSKNISVLENEVKLLTIKNKNLWVIGLADLGTRFPDINGTFEKINDNNPVIVLSHNPDVFPFLPDKASLTISGHTHGGQLVLPFIGNLIVPSAFGSKFSTGHIDLNGKHLFVSNGIGTSNIPVRLGAVPEVVILEVVSES